MSEYLFIRPNLSVPRDYSWFAYDDVSKNVISSGHSSTVEGLAQTNSGSPERSVVLLYPASASIFRKVTFPGKLKKSAYNSLLYVIEDDLAEDVEQFSVRVLERQGDEYHVLIYRHNELRNLEKALEMLGLSVDIIVPDVLTMPFPEKNETEFSGYVMKYGDVWLVRSDRNTGMEVREEWLPFIAGTGDAEKKFISLSELPEGLKDKWQESLAESAETVLAAGAIKSKLNLSSKQRKINYQIKFVRSWVKVAVLVVIMFALWFVNMSYRTKAIMQETMDYRNQQRNLFRQISNNNGNVSDPVGEMKQLIENSSPIGTDEGFVDLSKILVPYVTSKKNLEMVSLKFDRSRKTFTLQFLADGSFDKEGFLNDLSPDFSGSFTESKPSRSRMLNTVQLRRSK